MTGDHAGSKLSGAGLQGETPVRAAVGEWPLRRGVRRASSRFAAWRPRRFAADAREAMKRDIEAGRDFLWWPIAFAVAAAIYFALPVEPPLLVAVVPATMLVTLAVAARVVRARVPIVLMLATMAAAGFLVARIHVEAARTPVLAHGRVLSVEGVVQAVEDRGARGHRLRIAVEALEPSPREGTPGLVRVTVRSLALPPLPGERVRLRARLGPPQAPLYPGGYDFARAAFFAGIGGVGFALGPVEWANGEAPPGTWATTVERFRLAISARIRSVLPGDAGAIAAALIVGDRGAIDPATDDAMRVSGLSHILAISGLHMALVAACLYGGLRGLLAMAPALALRLPIKSVAAAVALAGTLAYLVIAGMGFATQRSAVMIAITLTAVMIGRRPFSLRSVAVAALVVLFLYPSAVLDPGAQLSFAAVTALIAAYEAVSARRKPKPDGGDVNRLVRALLTAVRWIGLSMLTSLIAGIATTPVALHHFNRAAPLGLVANLMATPIVSFLIMPAGLIAALGMPVGLDGWPLAAMGAGIDAMVWIARTVTDWTPGNGTFGRPALAGTLTLMAGGLWLCVWTGKARLLGVPVVVAGIALSTLGERPDLVVAGDGRRALIMVDGRAVLLGRPDDFETGIWLAAIGDTRDPDDPSLVANVRCDSHGCILREPPQAGRAGAVIAALVHRPQAFGDECPEARLVIASIPAPDWCRELTTVLDAADLQSTGARTFRVLGNAAPDDGVPEDAALDIAVPDNAAPHNAVPNNAAPDNAAPHNAAPHNAVPDNGVLGNAAPHNAVPNNAVPDSDIPDNGVPDIGVLDIAVPDNAAANNGDTHRAVTHVLADAPGRGWSLTELDRAMPAHRRPFHIGAP